MNLEFRADVVQTKLKMRIAKCNVQWITLQFIIGSTKCHQRVKFPNQFILTVFVQWALQKLTKSASRLGIQSSFELLKIDNCYCKQCLCNMAIYSNGFVCAYHIWVCWIMLNLKYFNHKHLHGTFYSFSLFRNHKMHKQRRENKKLIMSIVNK